jgi:hypothetical protein
VIHSSSVDVLSCVSIDFILHVQMAVLLMVWFIFPGRVPSLLLHRAAGVSEAPSESFLVLLSCLLFLLDLAPLCRWRSTFISSTVVAAVTFLLVTVVLITILLVTATLAFPILEI